MKKDSKQPLVGMFKGAPSSSFKNAENLRKKMTQAESILWKELRDKRFLGLKFRRQHPIQFYIVDFYCHKHSLVIELDGGYHSLKEQKEKDIERESVLNDLGFIVLRFNNEDVENRLDYVLNEIKEYIETLES